MASVDNVTFFNLNNYYVPNYTQTQKVYNTSNVHNTKNTKNTNTTTPLINSKQFTTNPSFKSQVLLQTNQIKTTLTTRDEHKKYNELSNNLNTEYRKKLEFALKSGQLLKNNSDDKSSVLDNLYKIMTTERDPGLNNLNILKECLDILSNPYVITQTCEDIPQEYQKAIIGLITNLSTDPKKIANAKKQLNNMHTGTCPAASIEFDLATKHTADFFRMVEGLTSLKNQTTKFVEMKNLTDNKEDAKWLLSTFKTPHVMINDNCAKILLKPDKNAIIRARIQNHHRDKGERSMIDVLIQSTLMQLGSQQTYDSLLDKRATNEWTQDDSGLIDFEKTYAESIIENKNTTSITYQIVDEEGRLKGYEKDFKTIKKDLLDTLNMGHNIIIGYTWPDPSNGNRLAGHEITIVGYKIKPNGEGVFICQDSDDKYDKPIEMTEKYLLPKIHHAGLPEEIATRYFPKEIA